jgi:hypothetical protein
MANVSATFARFRARTDRPDTYELVAAISVLPLRGFCP